MKELEKYKITINGHPVVKTNKLDIKLTKEQEEFYEQIATNNNKNSGSLQTSWDIDPYKEFKRKMKEQIKLGKYLLI